MLTATALLTAAPPEISHNLQNLDFCPRTFSIVKILKLSKFKCEVRFFLIKYTFNKPKLLKTSTFLQKCYRGRETTLDCWTRKWTSQKSKPVKMVMHRALLTWFILLAFLILLSLRLETRTHWNWFLIFIPMWIFDVILLIDVLFNVFIRCKHEDFKSLFRNKNVILMVVVLLKIAAQIVLCLKLQYQSLQLSIYHVLTPLWIMFPILIMDASLTLFKNSNW